MKPYEEITIDKLIVQILFYRNVNNWNAKYIIKPLVFKFTF